MYSLSCILNILREIYLSLILFNTCYGIYSVPKESKYTAVFLSINNETQYVSLLFCHRDLWHAPSLILDKLLLEKCH